MVWLSKSTSGRSSSLPEGREDRKFVRVGISVELCTQACTAALKCLWTLEIA